MGFQKWDGFGSFQNPPRVRVTSKEPGVFAPSVTRRFSVSPALRARVRVCLVLSVFVQRVPAYRVHFSCLQKGFRYFLFSVILESDGTELQWVLQAEASGMPEKSTVSEALKQASGDGRIKPHT